MLLYENKKNSINVYSFDCNPGNIMQFKKDQLELIPEDERLFFGIPIENATHLENNDRMFVPCENGVIRKFCLTKNKQNQDNRNTHLNLYFYSVGNNYRGIISDYLKITKYYLINNSKRLAQNKGIGSVLQVPESLYNLQLILNEEFNLLTTDDLDNLLELFTFEKSDEIDINKFKGNLKIIKSKAKNDGILLKKLTRK